MERSADHHLLGDPFDYLRRHDAHCPAPTLEEDPPNSTLGFNSPRYELLSMFPALGK
jgi:hypothetical protein